MQRAGVLLLGVALAATSAQAGVAEASPVGKVIQLLSDLSSKIIAEGEKAQKVYAEYSEWCEERNKNLGFEIKTGSSEVAALKATIEQETATMGALTAKIEELTGAIATDEADLKAATEIREKEAISFGKEEKELVEIVDTLQRAIGLLEGHGASMLQVKNGASLAQALAAMVKASVFSSADADRLAALQADDSDADIGAPAAAVYEGHSGDIVATLEGLLDKAQTQLDGARKTETTDLHNFEMLKQSLEDQIKFGKKELADSHKALAAAGEGKAAAEGDLKVTSAELASDQTTLADLHHNCMTKAQDFEAAVKSRSEELKALAGAKKAIMDNTVGADSVAYGLAQVSLLQVDNLRTSADLAHFEAVRFVRDLARKLHSKPIALLASRMASAMRVTTDSGVDPFGKVKGLIADMISRLEADAEADATHKAYCDKEISESNVKKDDKTAEITKLSTEIDSMSARSGQLKEEVAALQKALAELAASQAEMDKMRMTEKAQFVSNKADMEQGLEGVKMALKILTEYYNKEDKAHDAALGAGGGVIGLLEVVESDFSKTLAELTATEDSAVSAYEQQTKENEIEKASKDQDVKYKTKESKDLDKAVSEATSDRSVVQTELDAVNEYLSKLHAQCDEKVEPYEETKRRREEEIAGLKEALSILSGEAVLLQQGQRARRKNTLRGAQVLRAA